MRWIALLLFSVNSFALTSTTTSLTTQQVAYVVGTPIIFQAYVTPTAATGTLTFMDGSTTLGICTMAIFAGPGEATSSPSHKGCNSTYTLTQGSHTLTAVYSGDSTYAASTSAAKVNFASAVATSPQPASAMSLGLLGALNGFVPNPNGPMRQRIDMLPADSNSTAILADWGVNYLHADGGLQYGCYGIPYYVVNSTGLPGLTFKVADDGENVPPSHSDITNTWPATNTMQMENHCYDPHGDPNAGVTLGDDHLNILDIATGIDYETYHTRQLVGQYPALMAVSSAMWDMTARAVPQARTVGLTSTEAGGLSVFDGIVRYDEIVAGVINHAIRYQTDRMAPDHYANGDAQDKFTFPATHTADSTGAGHSTYQHYGMRIRLKSSFDISSYSAANQVILTAMKQYGLILTDIGSRAFFTLTPDSRWNADDLANIQSIPISSNFEVVEEPTLYAPDRYPSGTAATISSFTATASSIPFGTCTNLSIVLANAPSYSVIDALGFFSGTSKTSAVCPLSTTTYTLTTTNPFLAADDTTGDGHRNAASLTVQVTGVPRFQSTNMTNVPHN